MTRVVFQTAKMHLSFQTAKDLRNRIEILPRGPLWKSKDWKTPYPTKRPLTLFFRDPLECLQALLSNPIVQDFIHFTPFKLFATSKKLMRIYTEWLSGDAAWRIQVSWFVLSYDERGFDTCARRTYRKAQRCLEPCCLPTRPNFPR